MNKSLISIAEAYYVAMGDKNITEMEKYLHPDIHFMGPLAEMKGKIAFIKATKEILNLFNTLTIRAKFDSGDKVMMAYDLAFPPPIGNSRGATLLTFQEGLISKIELFYDARPFEKKDESNV